MSLIALNLSLFIESEHSEMMIKHWKEYLQQFGAQWEGDLVNRWETFEQERQHPLNSDSIMDLSHLGVIEVGGPEAGKFLQGQLTNDVRQVNPTHSQFTAWCSPKGRVLATFYLFEREKSYYLLLPKENLETVLKQLHKYILRAQVTLQEVNRILLGISGNRSVEILSECLGYSCPQQINEHLMYDEFSFLHLQGTQIIVLSENPTQMENLWECLVKKTCPQGTSTWQLLDILAGIPHILPTTSDEFIPQMINLHDLGGINFKKGCYTGQEIIARTQYLGTLKRRMYLVKIATGLLPAPGEKLLTSEGDTVGTILNAQRHPDYGIVALAVIAIPSITSQSIYFGTVPVELMDLPYVTSL